MAAVLTALVPLVKETSKQYMMDKTNEEFLFLLGVSGEIKKLEDNLEKLEAFLVDAERKCIIDTNVRGWVRKLKDAMYYAIDTLELCQLDAEEWQESRGGSLEERVLGCCQPLLICMRNPILDLVMCGRLETLQDFCASFFFCLRNPVFAHGIGARIKWINEQLDGIRQGVHNFSFINLSSYQDQHNSGSRIDAIFGGHTTASMADEFAIVGDKIRADTNKLVHELTANDSSMNSSIKVVSIVGPGGMGKSTLAQCIFNHGTIKEQFKIKIWLSVTKNFNEIKLLRNAIAHAGGQFSDAQDKSLLMQTLANILSTSKFLLVMDDVWSVKAWNDVLSVPTGNASCAQPGSRVLITTRYEDLAQQMRTSFQQHHVTKLGDEDAWLLLTKQLSPNQVARADHYLKGIGMNIIAKCDGLPLAIKLMGGLLSTRSPIESEWTAVLDNPTWSVAGLPSELDNRLYLSYEDLSPQLKQCFLYYSLLRNDRSIPRDPVIHMWISEGFIQPLEGSSLELEEIAIRYHRELIKRNLIEPSEKYRITGNECTMHDVVRSFAQHMAREELLVLQDENAGVGSNEPNNTHVRHMSIGPSVPLVEWDVLKKHELLRTLVVDCRVNIKPGDSLGNFSSLRVLHITGPDFGGLVDSLCQLKHLRYLHLENTDISKLPNGISKMKFLQYIMILNCKVDNLPSSIIELVHLRALWLDGSNITVVPRGFGRLTNLRELLGFPVHVDTDGGWCSLQEIEPLSQLRLLRLESLDHVSDSSFAEKAMINNKAKLRYLHLKCTSRFVEPGAMVDQQRQEVIEEVFDKLFPPPSIETFDVDRYYGRRLPNWMSASRACTFRNLRHMQLNGLTSCTDLPDGLCQLPSLEFLVISDARAIKRVGPEFQSFALSSLPGGGNTAVAPPFPRLKYLRLEGLCEWEDWDWKCDGSAVTMPDLEDLYIKDCGKLSRLPVGLSNGNRISLKKILLCNLTSLTSVDNFPSVEQLHVFNCPEVKEINGVSRLQEITIVRCPALTVLEGAPMLHSIVVVDATMKTFPEYLRGVTPGYLKLVCSKQLYDSEDDSEWDKIRHITGRRIYYFQERR